MTQVVVNNITSGYNLSKFNNNFTNLSSWANTIALSMSGGNNVMHQDFDMNGFQILNAYVDQSNPKSLLTIAAADSRYYKFHNVATPLVALDASNKLYTDNQDLSVRSYAEALVAGVAPGAGTGAFQQAGTGPVTRTFQNKQREILTAEDFGAVGNGIADDTAAFTGINSVLALQGGGVVRLASKVYNVPNGWVIGTSNTTIEGNGATIKSTGSPNHALQGTGLTNITVKNLKLQIPTTNFRTGGFASIFVNSSNIRFYNVKTLGGVAGAWFFTCNDVVVDSCIIDTPKADGIHFGQGSFNCKAINNTILNPGDDALACTFDAGFSRPYDIQFVGNTVRGGYWGFGVAVYSSDDVIVANNNITGTALGAVQVVSNIADSGTPSTNVLVTGNKSYDTNKTDVVPNSYWTGTPDVPITSPLQQTVMVLGGDNIVASGNSINKAVSVGAVQRTGITMNQGGTITISDNHLYNIGLAGISTGNGTIGDTIISNNNLHEVLGTGIDATGATIASMKSMVISGNSCTNGQTTSPNAVVAVANTGTNRVAIVNNTSAQGRGITVFGSSTNVLQANNNF